MTEPVVMDPKDPRLVDDLIERARTRPDGIELLRDGWLGSVAMIFSVLAFTVEAARARLQSAS